MSVRTKIVTVTDMDISPKAIDAGIVDEHNATLLKFILPMDYIDNDYLYFLDIVNGSGGESPTAHMPAVLEEVNGDTVTTVSFELPDYITRLGVANVTLNVEELNSGDNTIVDLLVRTIPISLKFTGQKKTNGTIILELTDIFNALLVRIEVAISESGVATANAIIATVDAVTATGNADLATGRANAAAAIVENSLLIVDTVDDLDPDAEDGTKATVRSVEQYVNNHIPILVNTYYDKLYINPTPEYIVKSDVAPVLNGHINELYFEESAIKIVNIYFAGFEEIPDTALLISTSATEGYFYIWNAGTYFGKALLSGWHSIIFGETGIDTATAIDYADIPAFEGLMTYWYSNDGDYVHSALFGNYLSSTPYYVTAEYVPYIFDTEWKRVYNNITGVYGMDGTISTVETYADLAPTAPDDTIMFVEKDTIVEQPVMTIVPNQNYAALHLKPIIDIVNLPYLIGDQFILLQTDYETEIQPAIYGGIDKDGGNILAVPSVFIQNFVLVQIAFGDPTVTLDFSEQMILTSSDIDVLLNPKIITINKNTWNKIITSSITISQLGGGGGNNYTYSTEQSDGRNSLSFTGVQFSNTGDFIDYILPNELFSETPWVINYSGFYKMIDGTWTLIKKGDWNPKIIVQEEPT